MEKYEAKHSKQRSTRQLGRSSGSEGLQQRSSGDSVSFKTMQESGSKELADSLDYRKTPEEIEKDKYRSELIRQAQAAAKQHRERQTIATRRVATKIPGISSDTGSISATDVEELLAKKRNINGEKYVKESLFTKESGSVKRNATPNSTSSAEKPAGSVQKNGQKRIQLTEAQLMEARAKVEIGRRIAARKKARSFKNIMAGLLVGLISLMLVMGMVFYLLIGVGLSPKLQTLWVTTAMTTNSHKWLATAIVSEERIKEIMEKETIDDSNFDTDLDDEEAYGNIDFGDTRTPGEREDQYMNRGYGKLENGLYMKVVSGKGWRGNVMLVENPLDVVLTQTPTQGTKGTTVRRMVELAGGIAGVNGGGFNDGPNYDSNGGKVAGLLIINGKLINPTWDDGGYLYNMIGFNSNGRLILRHCSKEWAKNNDIKYAVSFSPFLIVNGKGTVPEGSTGGWGIAPRTAIGQLPTGEVLFLCIDGRQPAWSIGCDLDVLQNLLLEEGCENAAMMDGGSSTVMIYNNEFVNKPSLGHERFINNAWVVLPRRFVNSYGE